MGDKTDIPEEGDGYEKVGAEFRGGPTRASLRVKHGSDSLLREIVGVLLGIHPALDYFCPQAILIAIDTRIASSSP